MSNEEKYRAMAVPHADYDAAKAALAAFLEDVRVAREKHRIRNVLAIAECAGLVEGAFIDLMQTAAYGDSLRREAMAAMLYGQEKAEHAEMLALLLAGKGRAKA